MNRMIFRSFRKRTSSQKNTNTVYSEYCYSGKVSKESATRLASFSRMDFKLFQNIDLYFPISVVILEKKILGNGTCYSLCMTKKNSSDTAWIIRKKLPLMHGIFIEMTVGRGKKCRDIFWKQKWGKIETNRKRSSSENFRLRFWYTKIFCLPLILYTVSSNIIITSEKRLPLIVRHNWSHVDASCGWSNLPSRNVDICKSDFPCTQLNTVIITKTNKTINKQTY